MNPQGRLSQQVGIPIPTQDTNTTLLCYSPYADDCIPVDGVSRTFGNLSHALDSNTGHTGYQAGGGMYDEFVADVGSTLMLGSGPAWSSVTSRGTGSGSSELEQVGAYRVNKYAITFRYGDGANDYAAIDAGKATYVGSWFATNPGATRCILKPGPNTEESVIGYWNAHNRVLLRSTKQTTASQWTYSGAIRPAGADTHYRIYWVDGLGKSMISARYASSIANVGNDPQAATIGVGIDQIDEFHWGSNLNQGAFAANSTGQMLEGSDWIYPLQGLHYAQALEVSTDVPIEFFGHSFGALTVELYA